MKKFNVWIGMALAIVSILVMAAIYFNVIATVAFIANLCFGVFVGFIAMMQTYYYKDYHEYNPTTFWFMYSLVASVVIVIFIFAMGGYNSHQELCISVIKGGYSTVIPGFGLFLGYVGKSLFR